MPELKAEKFITFTRECGPTIFDSFITLCAQVGFTPHIQHRASQLNSVFRLVESGFDIALLPQHVQKEDCLNLKYSSLRESTNLIS